MRMLLLTSLSLALAAPQAALAQAPKKLKPAAAPAAPTPAPAPAKDSLEAQAARTAFEKVLDTVGASWFGAPYQDVRYVDLDGTLAITLSTQALNAKAQAASEGRVKGNATSEGRASVRVKSTYFANADFRSEFNGDFGNLLWTRVGNRGFLYSKEQNAYTTRVDPPPSDAPLSYLGWFQQCINDLKAVYLKASTFKASFGPEVAAGDRALQTVVFYAPTGPYDARKRDQSLADTLGFWKRGKLAVAFDKATRQPYQVDFSNDEQGVRVHMEFSYTNGKLQAATLTNSSRGFEGPGNLRIAYGADGLPSALAGELVSQQKKIAFDLNLAWGKGKKAIASVPPPNAAKRGREEMETYLLVAAAGNVMELQRNGLNFRAPKTTPAK